MTKDEAEALCGRLADEDPDRHTHRWFPRVADGEWTVVKVPLPPGLARGPLREVVEAKPRPQQQDDPRTTYDRNVGGPWVV
jgi:hypothetical protein